jgi:hypothetical protein
MSYFLALDAGGTKTDYVLADETRELARVRTGTIKRMRIDAATACHNLESALAELSALTGVSMKDITRTCVGTAGETVSLVTDWLHESITARVGGGLLILGDVEIALDAAFPGRAGVLVLAGTGSNVVGRTSQGVGARRSPTRDRDTLLACKACEQFSWLRTKSGTHCYCPQCWTSGNWRPWMSWWDTPTLFRLPTFRLSWELS